MKKIGKNALILWICAGVALIGALGNFSTNFEASLFTFVIAAVLAFIGYKYYDKYKKELTRKELDEAVAVEKSRQNAAIEQEQKEEAAAKIKADEEAKKRNEAKFETILVKVAGVTYDNEDGKSRQAILKKIKNNSKNGDRPEVLSLKQTKYKGEDAIAILSDGVQIGSVPAVEVSYLIDNWDRIYDTPWLEVYGGGYNSITEERKNYGAELTIRILRDVKA